MQKTIKLSQIVEKCNLEIVHKSSDYGEISLNSKDVNRPGLQLTGYMGEFPYKRLQIIGRVEYTYLTSLDNRIRYERFRGILSYKIPAIIFSYDQQLPKDLVDLADYYDKTILRSNKPTTNLISILNQSLELLLAEETNVHGELLDVFGTGVLITGKSSVGKSETALDLVRRGHRLVADDMVDIIRYDDRLIGSCPENIRYYMELRGLGIIDVRRLYGIGSIKQDSYIDMVIQLEKWNENYEYDRLGLDDKYTEILGVQLPTLLIPVRAGRNIAMITEAAVMNQRQKNLGHNSAVELTKKLFKESQNKE